MRVLHWLRLRRAERVGKGDDASAGCAARDALPLSYEQFTLARQRCARRIAISKLREDAVASKYCLLAGE